MISEKRASEILVKTNHWFVKGISNSRSKKSYLTTDMNGYFSRDSHSLQQVAGGDTVR
jgi:hypothetical protein